MTHTVSLNTGVSADGHIVGVPVCSCGWQGRGFDIEEPSERKAYESAALTHRVQVNMARGASCFLVATAVLWGAVLVAGGVWLFRMVTGW
jgi:hypothetical protein